jgi:type VI secretion system protein ImpJ
MYLAISTPMSKVELIRKTPELIKISSGDYVEHLVQQAVPGVDLTYAADPPVRVKTNYVYFSLNRSGDAWNAVTRARNLAAYVPTDFADPQLELIVVLPQRR